MNPPKIKTGPPNQPEEIGDIVRYRGDRSFDDLGVCHNTNPNFPNSFWVWFFNSNHKQGSFAPGTLCHKFELEKVEWDDATGSFYVKQFEKKKNKNK